MPKVMFFGGGSSKFVFDVTRDLFTFPSMREATISLMDVDERRLAMTEALLKKMVKDLKLGARIEATTDRRRALEGADYVIVTIMVGRFKAYALDVDIPAKYGVYQCVGDTIGPGGVFRYLRTAPVLNGLADDVRAVAAPDCWVINYSNPMAMNCWGMLDHGFDRVVGLCHSIQMVAKCIADWVGVPFEDLVYNAGGINHVNFYLRLEHRGEDLYPRLMAARDQVLSSGPGRDSLTSTFDLMEQFGYWAAETGFHQTEYYPWFRKTRDMGDHDYHAPFRDGLAGNQADSDNKDVLVPKMTRGEAPIDYARGVEYAAYILDAMETGAPYLFYGNLRNNGLIENLPARAVVEVPCIADRTGVVPGRVGRIPEILAGVMQPHIAVHELAVKASIERSRRLAAQAIMLDPLTGALLTLPRIRAMVDEMFEANREWLPDYR
jgi:alpha-galactosidase